MSEFFSSDDSEIIIPIIAHDDGSWSFIAPVEPFDSSEHEWLPDSVLRDSEINFKLALPGEAVNHNVHSVVSGSSSTEFMWGYKGIDGIKEFNETVEFADT